MPPTRTARDAQKITSSRREPCSSRTFLEVVVNLDEIRTERNSLRDNGVDFASVSRNHERLITGNVARNNYEMHRPRAVWVDSVGAALVLKSGRAPLHAVYENNVLLDKIARTVELYDPNPVLQSGRGVSEGCPVNGECIFASYRAVGANNGCGCAFACAP